LSDCYQKSIDQTEACAFYRYCEERELVGSVNHIKQNQNYNTYTWLWRLATSYNITCDMTYYRHHMKNIECTVKYIDQNP